MVRHAPPTTLAADAPALVDAVDEAAVTVVIGEVNAGKTTLVARLATALHARGRSVGVLDADVGQAEVGPPTTVGLGRVVRPLGRLGDAERVALRFVGATSAVRDQLATVIGVARLAARARELGLTHVLVDTSGLVRGDLGLRLKQAKIDAVDADLVLAIDRDGECEPIVGPYRRAARPRIVGVLAAAAARSRSPEERRLHRERAFAAHFAGARRVVIDLGPVALRRPALFVGEPIGAQELADAAGDGPELVWGERRGGEVAVVCRGKLDDGERRAVSRRLRASGFVDHAAEDIVGMLAGLEDGRLETVALGAVLALDFGERAITVDTTADVDRVTGIAVGRERAPALNAR
jgi:polynucleotide 5'-hydroxyl-kinase GRC3/NOL9